MLRCVVLVQEEKGGCVPEKEDVLVCPMCRSSDWIVTRDRRSVWVCRLQVKDGPSPPWNRCLRKTRGRDFDRDFEFGGSP